MMSSSALWSIIGFVLILTPVILIHEWGHFIAARLSKIKVDEFGIGFPPRAATLFWRNGTRYSINWIPVGGFVRPAGEDDPSVPGGLAAASKKARLFVLGAGSGMNFILAIILFAIMFMLPRPLTEVVVGRVDPNSPAETAGLRVDDALIEVNGIPIGESFRVLAEEIRSNAGSEVRFIVRRDGREITLTATPRRPGTYDASREGALGIQMSSRETGELTALNPFEATQMSVLTIGDIIYSTLTLPVQLMRSQIAPSDARVVSVVGISQMAGYATKSSIDNGRFQDILWMMAVISVALGFTNLLPIPALDGGRIIFVLVEAIRGRRIEPEKEGMVHAIGMALLLGLMVILIVQDIINPIQLPS